ncbi:MAG: diaminopimelate epimerase [Alphaproteobacteria bacterium]|nr:MAG: diaminopimelate epimerase [Alphaproteobacteria bacterium]
MTRSANRTPFVKMHGLGNDFVIIDARLQPFEVDAARVKAIADRRSGVGCDQLIKLEPAKGDGNCYMRIWNADGGEVEACGNASRCVARLLTDETGNPGSVIETGVGPLICTTHADGRVTVDMGKPGLEWQQIPLSEEMDTRRLAIGSIFGREGGNPQPAAVNTGNPHCVFFVDNVASVPLEKIGPTIENHTLFPERTNVEFAEITGEDEIRLRVWERGTGITKACGTGACATAVAAARKGLTSRRARVILDGGALDIEWRDTDDHILMTGDATLVYEGQLTDEIF